MGKAGGAMLQVLQDFVHHWLVQQGYSKGQHRHSLGALASGAGMHALADSALAAGPVACAASTTIESTATDVKAAVSSMS